MEDCKQINILLVEDDPEDVQLTQEVLQMTKMKLDIDIARDGIEALEFLNNVSNEKKKGLPDLILLDLNMPRMNGHEFIREVKNDHRFSKIPVVVLSTSSTENDIKESYTSGVSCYITKPVGLKEFQKVVEAINNFWFTVVKFPDNLS